jgi:hypothetical protein
VEKSIHRKRQDHRGHVDVFERLNVKHSGHVIERERWRAKPWKPGNHLAHLINRFIAWAESGKW